MGKKLWLLISICMAAISLYGEGSSLEKQCIELETVQAPKYLYKVISLRQWQTSQNNRTVTLAAEDTQFIHLAKDDQLDRIVTKYWPDAPQYVVLKLDTTKLEGELVCEANPGGSTKYFHLYHGSIPCNSIVEAKVVYRQPLDSSNLHPLEVVRAGDPVLRQVARDLSVEEIRTPEIQTLIQDMKTTMRASHGVGLAAPQVGKSIRLVVIEDMDHSHLTPEQLAERDRRLVPFHVVINPHLYVEGTDTAEFFEGCLSFPQLLGIVSRAKSVRVECLNEKAEPVVIRAGGWYARILQHEIDHLNGISFVDRCLLSTIMTEENYVKFWKGKSIQEIVEGLQPSTKNS